jgi:hypothetical protein
MSTVDGLVICNHQVGSNPVTNYVLATCPRCQGKGVYGGINYDARGDANELSGVSLLVQQIQKVLTENRRPSGYGFDYNLMAGVIDAGRINAIKSELIRALSYLKFVQQSAIAAGFQYLPTEELDSIGNLTIQNDPNDPRKLTVAVTVVSVSGTQTSTTVDMRR